MGRTTAPVLQFVLAVAFAILSLLCFPFVGCGQEASTTIPLIPPLYYSSTEVAPGALAHEYWNPHLDVPSAKLLYDGRIFIFKNILLDDTALKHKKEGYLRLEMVKAYITNTNYLARLKVGDLVDIVGINGGVASDFVGLNFIDCIVLPASSVQIPIGGTSAFMPQY